METSSKTCVAVDTGQATLFVALELSQATWLVGLHSPIVNAGLKLSKNQRFEIAMADRPARSFERPRCSSPAGLHRRSLGGKRGPGDSPLSRP